MKKISLNWKEFELIVSICLHNSWNITILNHYKYNKLFLLYLNFLIDINPYPILEFYGISNYKYRLLSLDKLPIFDFISNYLVSMILSLSKLFRSNP